MAYLGRPASAEVSVTGSTDTFTGDGNVAFTLSRVVTDNNPSLLEVFVSNVQQQPTVTFSVANNVLTFTSAPGNGEPIYVTYRDYPVAPVFTVPDASITAVKLANDSVTNTKIGSIAVTEGKIANQSVTEAKIGSAAVTTSKIADTNVTTAKIADASITSAKLSSNLLLNGTATFLGGSIEKANIVASNVTSNVNLDPQDAGIVFFTNNTTANANVTVNFLSQTNVSVGNISSFVLILTNNVSRRAVVTAAQIEGQAGNVFRFSGGTPTAGSNIDVYSFSIIKTNTSSYTILGAKSEF